MRLDLLAPCFHMVNDLCVKTNLGREKNLRRKKHEKQRIFLFIIHTVRI